MLGKKNFKKRTAGNRWSERDPAAAEETVTLQRCDRLTGAGQEKPRRAAASGLRESFSQSRIQPLQGTSVELRSLKGKTSSRQCECALLHYYSLIQPYSMHAEILICEIFSYLKCDF